MALKIKIEREPTKSHTVYATNIMKKTWNEIELNRWNETTEQESTNIYINQQKVKNSHIIKHINQLVCVHDGYTENILCRIQKPYIDVERVYRTRAMNYSMASRNSKNEREGMKKKK